MLIIKLLCTTAFFVCGNTKLIYGYFHSWVIRNRIQLSPCTTLCKCCTDLFDKSNRYLELSEKFQREALRVQIISPLKH